MEEAYRLAMHEQLEQLQEECDELANILADKKQFNRMEFRAAERVLQVLVECCIGIAKQKLKSLGKATSGEARANFNRLAELGLTDSELPWNQIIGMRNAIVHDYLNIEPERIYSVLRQSNFKPLFYFCISMLDD